MLGKTIAGLGIIFCAISGGAAFAATAQGVTVDCGVFTRNPDGSWATIANADIQGPESKFVIGPRTELKVGRKLQGLDIALVLDMACR